LPFRFGEICKASERRDFGKLADSILNPPTLTGAAIIHGQVHEASAVKKFVELTGKRVFIAGKFISSHQGLENQFKQIQCNTFA